MSKERKGKKWIAAEVTNQGNEGERYVKEGKRNE